jgi:hypothetical protein
MPSKMRLRRRAAGCAPRSGPSRSRSRVRRGRDRPGRGAERELLLRRARALAGLAQGAAAPGRRGADGARTSSFVTRPWGPVGFTLRSRRRGRARACAWRASRAASSFRSRSPRRRAVCLRCRDRGAAERRAEAHAGQVFLDVADGRRRGPRRPSSACRAPPARPAWSAASARALAATGVGAGAAATRRGRTPRAPSARGRSAADGAAQLEDRPGLRRGDRDGGLVGHHLDHGLVFLDDVARLHEPGDDLALGHALADVRQLELESCHLSTSRSRERRPAGCGERAAGTRSRACTGTACRSRSRGPAAPRGAGTPSR